MESIIYLDTLLLLSSIICNVRETFLEKYLDHTTHSVKCFSKESISLEGKQYRYYRELLFEMIKYFFFTSINEKGQNLIQILLYLFLFRCNHFKP